MVNRKSPTQSGPAKPGASPVRLSIAKPRQKPPARSCGTCRYFARSVIPDKPELVEGSCRIRAIRLTMDGRGTFPPTRGDFWCGEWKA